MSQYPGYSYPTYPGYPPPPPADYYGYGNPYATNGYGPQPTTQAQANPYTSTSRHTRLPSDGNGAYSQASSYPNRETNNPALRRGHHARRNTTQGIGPTKEQRVLGVTTYRDEASASGAPDVSSQIRRELTPDFLFVSLSSSDILKLSGPRETISYLSEMLQSSWLGSTASEDGTEHHIRLGRDAWSANGEVGIKARKLICELFVMLAQEGYRYSTTINNHPLKAPRLVFTSGQTESQPRFFMICFSLNRRTAHIINAPQELALKIAKTLRVIMPFRPNEGATVPARTDGWIDTGVYEVTTSIEGGRVDFASLMSGSLKFIAAEGWRFEASVPFGRAGILGVRGRREAWVFRRHHSNSDYKSRIVPNPDPALAANVNVNVSTKQQPQQQRQRHQQRLGGGNVTVLTAPRDDHDRDRERRRRRAARDVDP